MKIFKEPLLIFLLLGCGLFVLFSMLNQAPVEENEIIVSQRQINILKSTFEKIWQRIPNTEEFDGVIQDYIRKEVYYREALALGLDINDGIVRNRLSQKMQFISENLINLSNPSDQELANFLIANQEDYKQPSRFSFRQIYINANQRGDSAENYAIELLTKLRSTDIPLNSDDIELGDPLMIKQQFSEVTETEIERALGNDFLGIIGELTTESWQGPVLSGFGYHLVYISKRIKGKLSELKDVRESVLRDWSLEKRRETNEQFYQSLRKQYKVIVEID